jgi:hypothetical protein
MKKMRDDDFTKIFSQSIGVVIDIIKNSDAIKHNT